MALSSIPSPEEALAGMARIGAPRQPMGNQAYMLSGAPMTGKATLMPRNNVQSGDPTAMGTKVNRVFGSLDRKGARYGIAVSYSPPMSPEAGATQCNGRTFRSSTNRDRVNFDQGILAHL